MTRRIGSIWTCLVSAKSLLGAVDVERVERVLGAAVLQRHHRLVAGRVT